MQLRLRIVFSFGESFMRRFAALLIASALAGLIAAGPALAQIAVGATVLDTDGGTVGTVTSVTGGNVTVDTGSHKVAIPEASFGTTPEGPLLAMTRTQLDNAAAAAEAQQKQQLAAAIVAGADVRGSEGAVIGKIDKIEGNLITLKGEAGSAKIPSSGLALMSDGLHFGMSAADFAAAVAAASAASAS
jgi:hypothetical protein